MSRQVSRLVLVAVSSVLAVAATAARSASGEASLSGKVALLLPETKTTRYETADRPYFEAEMKALAPKVEIIYSNADQDASRQLSQAEAAITNGAKVMVLDPVDSAGAASIADKAKAQGIPVIAYDRLILNSAGVLAYISFDNKRVGELQAKDLVNRLHSLRIARPTIVMINGAPTDNNAKLFKEGAHSVFDPLVKEGKLTIAKEYDTPDWSPDQAQQEMEQALTALNGKVDAVRVQEQPVVGDDRHALGLGLVGDGGGPGRVHGVENQHPGAVGERRLGLGELTPGVLIGVAVDDRHVRSELLHLALEVRAIGRLVAGGLGLRQEERHLPAEGSLAGGRAGRRGREHKHARCGGQDEP